MSSKTASAKLIIEEALARIDIDPHDLMTEREVQAELHRIRVALTTAIRRAVAADRRKRESKTKGAKR